MKKFEQLKNLYGHLKTDAYKKDLSDIFVSGITADFDRLFELSWKSMKEYLYNEKDILEAKSGSPKDIIKLAYNQGIIHNEDAWVKLLKDRNDDSHHYNESAARSYLSRIQRDYLKIIESFIEDFSEIVVAEPEILVEIPKSFLQAVENSDMYYDEFLEKMKLEYACDSELEFFKKWKENNQ